MSRILPRFFTLACDLSFVIAQDLLSYLWGKEIQEKPAHGILPICSGCNLWRGSDAEELGGLKNSSTHNAQQVYMEKGRLEKCISHLSPHHVIIVIDGKQYRKDFIGIILYFITGETKEEIWLAPSHTAKLVTGLQLKHTSPVSQPSWLQKQSL